MARIAAAGDVHASEATRERIAAAFSAVERAAARGAFLLRRPTQGPAPGEPRGVWTYLGCGRLATPIAEYRPDVVLHGHAHGGSFEGAIGEVPVYNVAVHVTGRDFYVFDLEGHGVEVDARA